MFFVSNVNTILVFFVFFPNKVRGDRFYSACLLPLRLKATRVNFPFWAETSIFFLLDRGKDFNQELEPQEPGRLTVQKNRRLGKRLRTPGLHNYRTSTCRASLFDFRALTPSDDGSCFSLSSVTKRTPGQNIYFIKSNFFFFYRLHKIRYFQGYSTGGSAHQWVHF